MRGCLRAGESMAVMATEFRYTDDVSPGRVVRWIVVGSLMFWPRLFMLGFFIFDSDIGKAFGNWVVPIIGFFVLPWTTVTWAAMWSISSNEVSGIEWLFVAIAVILDLITWAGLRRR
jgi:hypothetical protein